MDKFFSGLLMLFAIYPLTLCGEFFYKETDHIQNLNGDFNEEILKSNRISVVETYMDWCGYSKLFIPHYMEFANHTQLWHEKVLRVAAIDCAKEVTNNQIACIKNWVPEFPWIRLFAANSNTGKNIREFNEHIRSEGLMQAVIDAIEKQENKPDSWPSLSAYE
jgi:hypothetical protein